MDIPDFPEFRAIDVMMKDTIVNFLSIYPLEASEYTFTNLFAYKATYDFQVSRFNDNLIILKNRPSIAFFCPIGEMPELAPLFDYLKKREIEPSIERVPESFIRKYIGGNKKYIAVEDRDQFGYVYDVKELIDLKGRKFHHKKNKVNKFRNEHEYKYQSLTPELIEECIEFEDYWCELRECEKYYGLNMERQAILAILRNFAFLNLKGGVIKIDNKIAALSIGEEYLPGIMVIHVEKANPDIPGLYQAINQEFLIHEAGECKFVNREQDLGIEGLRQAKMSYHPVRFIKKYRVTERTK